MPILRRYSIGRKELYGLMWTKTLGEVASELGVRKDRLTRLCWDYDVPRPWSGYWSLKRLGKPAEPIPLPNPEKDCELEIKQWDFSFGDRGLRREAAEEVIRIGKSDLFRVRSNLRWCHRLISRTNKLINDKATRPWVHDDQIASPAGGVAFRVSKANVRRTLLLMDAILRGFEGLGYKVGLEREGRGATFVELLGVKVRFKVREYWSIKELANKGADPLAGQYGIPEERRRIKFVPAGRLRIEYRCVYERHGPRYSAFDSQYDCYEERLLRDKKNRPGNKLG